MEAGCMRLGHKTMSHSVCGLGICPHVEPKFITLKIEKSETKE